MACALLDPLGEHGENLLASEPVEDDDAKASASARGKKPQSEGSKKSGRAKKGQVVMLSSSYTCWRKVPEAWLHCLT